MSSHNLMMLGAYLLVAAMLTISLIVGVTRGWVADSVSRFTAAENPGAFGLTFVVRIAMIVFCLVGVAHCLGFGQDPMAQLQSLFAWSHPPPR